MASNINTTNIDVAYPVAGQDNDSQGFRDNFFNTNDNFSHAKTEIEALQVNTLVGNYDFDSVQVPAVGLDNYVLTYSDSTGLISLEVTAAPVEAATEYTTGAAVTLDTSAGTYFYPSGTGTAITFTFGSPAATGTVTSFKLELSDAGTDAPTWPAGVTWPAATEPTWTTGLDVVSFITRDNGTTWLGMVDGLAFA